MQGHLADRARHTFLLRFHSVYEPKNWRLLEPTLRQGKGNEAPRLSIIKLSNSFSLLSDSKQVPTMALSTRTQCKHTRGSSPAANGKDSKGEAQVPNIEVATMADPSRHTTQIKTCQRPTELVPIFCIPHAFFKGRPPMNASES